MFNSPHYPLKIRETGEKLKIWWFSAMLCRHFDLWTPSLNFKSLFLLRHVRGIYDEGLLRFLSKTIIKFLFKWRKTKENDDFKPFSAMLCRHFDLWTASLNFKTLFLLRHVKGIYNEGLLRFFSKTIVKFVFYRQKTKKNRPKIRVFRHFWDSLAKKSYFWQP